MGDQKKRNGERHVEKVGHILRISSRFSGELKLKMGGHEKKRRVVMKSKFGD